ncbi:MAG: molybdenum cofactor guanylyltransferase [Acidobacteria bacterium]|nr:molybdenum cofactor guanylyltransferase [Acidobacteriota bacterium]
MATGFVVAGGRSLRMGRDKALLPWGDVTLLDHAVARLRVVCGDVRILSGPETRYADRGLPVLVDVVSEAGALGGLMTGLQALAHDDALGLFLAVDLPLVPVELLRGLVARAEGFDAVVPVTAGGADPLCAAYRRTCLAPVRRRIAAGELKMTAFWPDVRVREVPEDELRALGDPGRMLSNVNGPEDYEDVRER